MSGLVFRLTVATLVVIGMTLSTSYAQSGTTRTALSGTVVDADGGVVPGATVEVKNSRTGVVTRTITNDDGRFRVPALDAGMYTMTVSLRASRRRSSPTSRCSARRRARSKSRSRSAR